ncbi:MAG: PQQ-binding-like beta-propeller repeat protein [Phycisphaerae bacterium]
MTTRAHIARCRTGGTVTLIAWLSCCGVAVADWPNFRGPLHDGISRETGIKAVRTEPLSMLWDRNIGSGYSSFACVGDHVYTCGTKDEQQVLFCLHADTGDVIWQRPFERAFNDSNGSGTRATPTVSDGLVYIVGGHGTVLCVDAATGKDVWRTQLNHAPYWGYSGSMLIEGNLAVAAAGRGDGSLVAFHKKTGDVVWKTGDDPPGYATPYPFTFNGRRYIAGFMGDAALIVVADTGREAWRMKWQTDWKVNAASPIYHDGHLLFSSGYGHGCILLKLRTDGDRLAADTVWQGKALRNKFQSPVLYDEYLYASDEKALKCVAWRSGDSKWTIPREKHGTVVVADGKLIYLSGQGQLQIGAASPDGFTPTMNADILSGRCWTVPVLHRGRLYARNLDRVVCFDLTR